MFTITTLASGSSGNAALLSCGDTHVLLDAGISARRLTAGLRERGVEPEKLSAILITHTHSDHIGGLQVLTRKVRVPILASPTTCRRLCWQIPFLEDLVREQQPGTGLAVGSMWVESFPTSHDAPGSVGYRVAAEEGQMALATDLGYISEEVARAVRGCDLLVCECNHDEDWVRSGPYPYQLKQRILGDLGHLSNEAGSELAAMAVQAGANTVLLAHLSQENNTPAHARQAACRRLRAMDCDPEKDVILTVAPRSQTGESYVIGKERGTCSACI